MTPLLMTTYEEIRAISFGVILGSALTVLLIVLQAMFGKPKRPPLELGTNHDRLDAEAAQAIADPIMQAGADRQASRLRAELDDDTAVDRWLGGRA